MPRTWSNRKVAGYASQAEREKAQSQSAGPFVIGLVIVVLIFGSVMIFVGYKAATHPSAVSHMSTQQNP